MSDTPRTDAEEYESQDEPITKLGSVDAEFARTIERELNAANDRIKNLESALCTVQNIDKVNAYQDLESANDRIKRLEEDLMDAKDQYAALVADVALYEDRGGRIKRLEEALVWYETKVSDCNRQGPEGDAARDALAKDYGRKAKEAKP